MFDRAVRWAGIISVTLKVALAAGSSQQGKALVVNSERVVH